MISSLNFLHVLFVLLSLFFQVLLVRSFGVAVQTDIYYLSISVVQFIYLFLSGYLLELFIPVYNDIKLKGEEKTREFVGAVFLLVFLSGTIVSVLVFLFASFIVGLVAPGFGPDKINLSVLFVRILSVYILFSSLNRVVGAVLNANLVMSLTYYTNLINPTLNILALVFFSENFGTKAVIYSTAFSSVLTFLIGIWFLIKKFGIKLSSPWGNNGTSTLIRESFLTKTGSLLYLLNGPIILNFFSYFPSGNLTIYSYTRRILEIIFMVSNSAVLKTLLSKASFYLARKKLDLLREYLQATVKANSILLLGAVIPSVFMFKIAFTVVFSDSVSDSQVETMYKLFIAFIPFYIIQSWRGPFLYIALTLKKGADILKFNLGFILILTVSIGVGIDKLGIMIFPVGMALGNLFSGVLLFKTVNQNLGISIGIHFWLFGKIVLFGVPFLFVNLFLTQNLPLLIYFNGTWIILWAFWGWPELVSVFRFMTRRGEIL